MPSRDSAEERARTLAEEYLPDIDEIPDRETYQYPAFSSDHLEFLVHGEDAVDNPEKIKEELRNNKLPLLATRLRYLVEDLMLLRNAEFATPDDWTQIRDDIQELSTQNEAYAPAPFPYDDDDRPTARFELAVQLAHLYHLISGGRQTLELNPEADDPSPYNMHSTHTPGDYNIAMTNLRQWNDRTQQDAIAGFLLGLTGRHLHVPDNVTYPDKNDVVTKDVQTRFTGWRKFTDDAWHENTTLVSDVSQEIIPEIESNLSTVQVTDDSAIKLELDEYLDSEFQDPSVKDPIIDSIIENSSISNPVRAGGIIVVSGSGSKESDDQKIIQNHIKRLCDSNVFTKARELTQSMLKDIEELWEHKSRSRSNPVRVFEVFHIVCAQSSVSREGIANDLNASKQYGTNNQTVGKIRNDLKGRDDGDNRWDNIPLIEETSGMYRPTSYGELLGVLLFPDAYTRDVDAYLPTPDRLDSESYHPVDDEFYKPSAKEIRRGCLALALEQPSSERSNTSDLFTAAHDSI